MSRILSLSLSLSLRPPLLPTSVLRLLSPKSLLSIFSSACSSSLGQCPSLPFAFHSISSLGRSSRFHLTRTRALDPRSSSASGRVIYCRQLTAAKLKAHTRVYTFCVRFLHRALQCARMYALYCPRDSLPADPPAA